MQETDAKTSIVVVDDEKYICSIIAEALSAGPYIVETFTTPSEAMSYIENTKVDLVLTDLVMGKRSGVEILELTLKHHPDAAVVMMTAHPTVQAAISVLKKGAYDFLVKPFKLDTLKTTITRGLEHQRVIRENIQLKEQLEFLKLSRANIAGTDLHDYINLLVTTCKNEFSAKAVSLIELDESGSEIKRLHTNAELESYREIVERGETLELIVGHEGEPVVKKNTIEIDGQQLKEVLISAPILMRRKLYGLLNILVIERFGTITPGQINLLAILTDAAASAMANEQLYLNLKNSYLQAIRALANAIEARDGYTAGHTDRVSKLAEATARYLGWSEYQIKDLIMGCTLHDVGKIGVPDSILNKPGKLTEDEIAQMRSHPSVGLRIIEGIELFKPAIKYIESHHEWYDGSGYPNGLKGEDIPIEGRLLAIVDTFDAIVSDRPYREGASIENALLEIEKHAGNQFDPQLVQGFLEAIRGGAIDINEVLGKTQKSSDRSVTEKASV